MTLLILGAAGQVGNALAARAGGDAIGLSRAGCDITDRTAVARAVAAPVSIVVNCAAYTAVDRAESERQRALAVNAEGAAIVARAAADRGLPLIHLSTDQVYAGSGALPHREDENVAPVNCYGETKAAGDAAVAAANPAHLILRVSWVFGVHGTNFVKSMLRLGRTSPELRIVADQHGGPTEARDIADAVLAIAAAARRPGFAEWGIYHFAGAPAISRHGFAAAIFAGTGRPAPRLVAVETRDYPAPAARPLNARLDCRRIRRVFGVEEPDWRISLARVLRDLGEDIA